MRISYNLLYIPVGSSHKKRKKVNGVENVLWGSYILPAALNDSEQEAVPVLILKKFGTAI